ncbi:MAG: erythromycin esterase family protein [Fimbriimonas sp.]
MKALSLLTLALATACLASAQSRQEPSRPDERARLEPGALAWLKGNIAPFAVDVPTPEDLKPMMAALSGARVVGIGEATHGDQQSQLFKTHAIRELVRQGRIESLMLEVNRTPGAQFDAFVNEGKGDLASLIADSGLFAIWRTDEFASLILWLRAHVLRTGKPIRIYGIDCQDAGADFAFALKWLERHNHRDARRIGQQLKPLTDSVGGSRGYFGWLKTQKPGDYKLYHDAGVALLKSLETQQGKKNAPAGVAEAIYAARTGIQGLDAFEFEFGPGDLDYSKAPVGYFARRDVFMGANLVQLLGKDRAALWAHDMHTGAVVPPLAAMSGLKTVGTELRRFLGEAYVAVGFAWTVGSFRAKRQVGNETMAESRAREGEIFSLGCDQPGDLGEFLGRVGPDHFYVDFRRADEATKAWAKLPYYRGWAGWNVDPKTWHTSPMEESAPSFPTHDILVYSRRIGPSTVWQLPAKKTR